MSTSCSHSQSFRLVLTIVLTFSLAAGAWPVPQRAAANTAGVPPQAPAQTNAEIEQQAEEAYGKLGVSFEENRGQVDERVRFLSRRGGATLFLTNDEASFVLSAPAEKGTGAPVESSPAARARGTQRRERPESHAVSMKFESANPWAEIVGERELEGKINYLRGDDPSKWRTNVRTFGAVRYREIYEGIDLVYYGNAQGQMEYDFEVAAGADPRQISLLIEGAKALEVDTAGDLVINTPAGELRQRRPEVYQEVEGERRAVEGVYVAQPDGRVRFALGEYDRSAPLIIDPVLEYSTYLGGGSSDVARGIAIDSARNAYVTGFTFSTDFPTKNPVQGTNGGGDSYDVFVTKLNATGTALIYSTYLGGSAGDEAQDIVVDSSGNAYVAGVTFSTNFPTANAIQSTPGGGSDAFVTKLNAAGTALVYSTYLGGGGGDEAQDIALDSSGNAYITGDTNATNFPTANAIQSSNGGGFVDAFVTKLNAAGTALVYSTYLGGSNSDAAYGVVVDSSGNAYVAGYTASTNFPVANAVQNGNGGSDDVFLTKLNAAGSAFVYSTYLGGSDADHGADVAVDSSGNAYIVGDTSSANFPTANAVQPTKISITDAFVAKLNSAGSALVYSTYLGGNNTDAGRGVALDSSGNAYVTGITFSTNFPAVSPVQPAKGGAKDAFVTRLNAAGSAFLYSTYLGGTLDEDGNGIAVDSLDSAYVAGYTGSTNFPVAFGYQNTQGSNHDAFVSKISILPSIRGRVTSGASAGVANVSVKLTGAQTITKLTNAQGYYSFTGLTPGGDYIVTPTKTGLSFTPASRTYTNLNANINNANFAVPSLSVNNVTVTEGNTGELNATFTVKLTPAATQTVTVKYQTAAGVTNPASAPQDYTPLPLSPLSFSPGQTSKTVSVKVRGDTFDEPNETFRLLLSGPTNALISDGEGVGTITDNDATPSLSVNNVAVTEGAAATFTVSLSAQSGQTVTVKYKTANGTATAPADYTAKGLTTLTFAPGEISKQVAVTTAGDTKDEAAETFQLQLSSPTNAIIAAGAGVGTINNNDPAPSITITNATVTEGAVNAVFTVKLSAASGQTVTVKYATGGGTATSGTDYTALALTTLTFSPGQTFKNVSVQVKGDLASEPNETFFLNLSGATNATITDSQGLGTILNDD